MSSWSEEWGRNSGKRRGHAHGPLEAEEPVWSSHPWAEAERRSERAYEHYTNGRYRNALDDLRYALSVDSERPDWCYGLGLVLDALERYPEATHAFQRVVDSQEDDVEALMHLGIDLVRSDQPHRALDAFSKVRQLEPRREEPLCHMILAHAMLGQHDDAEVCFYLARQFSDHCPACYDHLAQSLLLRDDPRGTAVWEQALAADPDRPGVALSLARAYWQRRQLERAEGRFLHHLRRNPGDMLAIVELADLLLDAGRPRDAAEKLRRALELDPDNADASHRLADIALHEDDISGAITLYEKAIARDPRRPGCRLGLAKAAALEREMDVAHMLLRAELEVDGQSAEQVIDIAHLLMVFGEVDLVCNLLDPLLDGRHDLLRSQPATYREGLLVRADALLQTGHPRLAACDMRVCLTMDQKDTAALRRLASAWLEAGSCYRAACALQRARRLLPRDRDLARLARRLARRRLRAALPW